MLECCAGCCHVVPCVVVGPDSSIGICGNSGSGCRFGASVPGIHPSMQPALHVDRIPADTFAKFWRLVGSRKYSTIKPALRAHEVNSLRLACDPQVVVDKYWELHPDIKLSRASMLAALRHAGVSQLQRVECMCEICLTFIQACEDVMGWLDDMIRLGALLVSQ